MENITPEPMHRKTKTIRIVALVIAVVALVVVAVLYFGSTDAGTSVLSSKEERRQAKLAAMDEKRVEGISGEETPTTPGSTTTGGSSTTGDTPVVYETGSASYEEMYTVKATKDVVYAAIGTTKLAVDIYTPIGVAAPTPAILYVHGGGFRGGSKKGVADDAEMLAKHGIAAIAIDYRLSGVAEFPAQIHDVNGAARYVRAHASEYNIDPNAIFSLGESAGGVLASLLGVSGTALEGTIGGNTSYSSDVAGVINISGSFMASIIDTMSGGIKNAISAVVNCTPVPSTACESQYKELSPETYISAGDAPFIILHGDKDGSVPTVQAETLHATLGDTGIPSEIHVAPDLAHVGGLLSRYLTQVINFVNTNS